MKQYLDERQNQEIRKYTNISFAVMFVLCAVAILVQLIIFKGSLQMVAGETIIMLAGGFIYLYGAIKTGTFSANGVSKGKNSIFINLCISIVTATIFSVAYGIMIWNMSQSAIEGMGEHIATFFVGCVVICFVVLMLLGSMSNKEKSESEKEYVDADDIYSNAEAMTNHENSDYSSSDIRSMEPVKIYMTTTSLEADMLVEKLTSCGINSFKRSVDGGVMDAYAGMSGSGDYIYVDERDAKEARQIIDEVKLS